MQSVIFKFNFKFLSDVKVQGIILISLTLKLPFKSHKDKGIINSALKLLIKERFNFHWVEIQVENEINVLKLFCYN